ncbi:SPASM domain-containing protein [Thermosipho melanesiensis]|uniref:SPASM domain-containing protein n=1 Tax=Thermosipho melanesiensis TaxID=46541 RepID=UPI0000ED37C4|nr:SPASM domain-containing protein [Thermosipho melanesiensis]
MKNNINLLKKIGLPISFEVTYTKLHKKLGYDLLKLYEYFYYEFNTTDVIISPVYDWNGSLVQELKYDASIVQEYYKLIIFLLEKSSKETLDNFHDVLLHKLLISYLNPADSLRKIIVSTFCSAGSNSFIVDIFGNIYPCQLVLEKSEYKISNVVKDNEENILRNIKIWRNKTLKTFTKAKYNNCKECYFLFFCNKCIFKNNYQNDMFKECHIEKKILEKILEFDP